MVERPWVAPLEVKSYSEYKCVKARNDDKVAVDISRAEKYVMSYTNNDFTEYEELPADVKTAIILVAEAYGFNACLESRELKSEQFDDYSYTAAEAKPIDIETLDIAPLLEKFSKEKTRNGVTLRMRKI